MSALPVLYSFRRCPYAMRARMALLISGAPCHIREIVLRDKPAELRAASPKATVPVLLLPTGEVIDESLDIMRWALTRHDPEGWLNAEADAMIAEIDGPFKHHLDRYKYPDRHASDPIVHRGACLEIASRLETRLAGRANLCRPHRSLADIAIFPFIRQFAATDQAWFAAQPLSGLQGWLGRHSGSPLFEQAMLRLTPWGPGDIPVRYGGER